MNGVDDRAWLESRPWIDHPEADILAYVRGLDRDPGFDLLAKLEQWKLDGEHVVSKTLIDELLEDIEYLKRHRQCFDLSVEIKGRHVPISECAVEDLDKEGTKLNSLIAVSRAAARLSLTREVSVFLRHVLGEPPCALQSLTYNRGTQQPVHIDYPYVRCQTRLAHLAASWIPLEDISPASGPLAYYPGSHRVEISGFFDWGGGSILMEPDSRRTPMEFSEYLWDKMKSRGIEPVVFVPKKGDAFIWHGNLAHEGTAILSPELTRKSHVTHYTSLSGYPPLHRKPDAIDRGHCLLENGGYVFEFPWTRGDQLLPSAER